MAPMLLRLAITVLCGVGLYTALFMLAKTWRAERGLVKGPSVVKTARARLFGPSNSILGTVYYPALAILAWGAHAFHAPLLLLAGVIAAGLAAATSAVLAYSLIFITKMPCPYCWTAHAVNWLLLALTFAAYRMF
jgi:uncharacterized membrane protein